MSVIRSIGWYKPYSDKQRGERILTHSEFEAIEDLFTPKEDDEQLLESYLISSEKAPEIIARIGMRFNLDSFEYYLEAWPMSPQPPSGA